MATALIVSFNITHVKTVASIEERATFLCYIGKLPTNLADHLSLMFIVFQLIELVYPLFPESTAKHLSFPFIPLLSCFRHRNITACLVFIFFLITLFTAFVVLSILPSKSKCK